MRAELMTVVDDINRAIDLLGEVSLTLKNQPYAWMN